MAERALFVDFMYAIAVGTALSRIDVSVLSLKNPQFWGIWFLIAVFVEDFYLYHKVVLPELGEPFPTVRALVLEMGIIASWYICQTAFPEKPNWFLGFFIMFFVLKLVGGVFMAGSGYPSRCDLLFLIPILAALVAAYFSLTTWKLLGALIPSWVLAVSLWWSLAHLCQEPPAPPLPH